MITRRWLMDEWRDTFTEQARLHGVPGPRIGEALAEIDTHCADSGESPGEAFGDPVDYAAALGRDTGAPLTPRRYVTIAIQCFAGLAGIMCLLNAADAFAGDNLGTIRLGQAVAAVAGGLAMTVLMAYIFRPGRRFTWRLIVGLLTPLPVAVFPQLLWKQPLLRLPAWTLVLSGLALLAVGWWPVYSEKLEDRIIDPRTGREPFRYPRLVRAAILFGLPVMLLATLALAVIVIGTTGP